MSNVGYIARRQFFSGEQVPQGEPYVVEVTEEPGCEDAFLHTPGGAKLARDGATVFATPEEALEDARETRTDTP